MFAYYKLDVLTFLFLEFAEEAPSALLPGKLNFLLVPLPIIPP